MTFSSYYIEYDSCPSDKDIQILSKGLMEYATLHKNQPPIETFAFFIHDKQKRIVGGCNGFIYYGCLYIDQLWIDEPLRCQGFGSQLMQKAEKLAHDKNCLFLTVNTMDWEALEFYKKMGFNVEFERSGYFNASTLYLLRKDIQ